MTMLALCKLFTPGPTHSHLPLLDFHAGPLLHLDVSMTSRQTSKMKCSAQEAEATMASNRPKAYLPFLAHPPPTQLLTKPNACWVAVWHDEHLLLGMVKTKLSIQ